MNALYDWLTTPIATLDLFDAEGWRTSSFVILRFDALCVVTVVLTFATVAA